MAKGYTTAEAAKMINRSRRTIFKWIQDGLISPERDDYGYFIFTQKDIDKLDQIKKDKLQAKISGVGGE